MWSNLPTAAAPLSIENERKALFKMTERCEKFLAEAGTTLEEDEDILASLNTTPPPDVESFAPGRFYSALLYRMTRKKIVREQLNFVTILLAELTHIERTIKSATAEDPGQGQGQFQQGSKHDAVASEDGNREESTQLSGPYRNYKEILLACHLASS